MAKWREITNLEEWNRLLKDSQEKAIFILKHSTTCPISAQAYQECERYLTGEANPEVHYVLVKVIESRAVSNQIAEDLKVKHESPQAILLKKGKAAWHASHWKIKQQTIQEILS